ncbi:hypothetical protein BGX26_009883 [Mortierella sp. AD094]|nr:hypothetical protein BGX26_009883 [Mortierella sp. AD094]
MPWNFSVVPDTERIEGMEKLAVKELFDKHAGTSSVNNDAFNIKACRMPFREPPPRDVPPFVHKAMLEYEYATQRYNLELLEYEQWRQGQRDPKENLESTTLSSTSPLIPKPIPPTKPLFVTQYELRNIREHPSSVDAPHPPFRATFILSKKHVSKFATDRNLVRKKLSAAVEMVFRKHARQGYEYLVFAKKLAMTTPQEKLIQLMKEAVTNPWLYGERPSRQKGDKKFSSDSSGSNSGTVDSKKKEGNDNSNNDNQEDTAMATNQNEVKVRWKNNRPPVHKYWWKHAMPNPLVRVQQTDEYLDQHCPKVEVKEETPQTPTTVPLSEKKK